MRYAIQLGQCVIYWRIYAFDVSSFVASEIGFRWNKVECPNSSQSEKKERRQQQQQQIMILKCSPLNITKHFNSFKSNGIVFISLAVCQRTKEIIIEFRFVSFCLLIYFCICFLSFPRSPSHSISTSQYHFAADRGWCSLYTYAWFQQNGYPAVHSIDFGRV